jgi:hypothetical protein
MFTLLSLILPVVLAWPTVVVPKQSCLWRAFEGITETDEIGNRIGRVDRQDWGCSTDAAAGGSAQTSAGVPAPPPPPGICFLEAYPNPATSQVRLGFSLSETQAITVVAYARETGHGPPRVLEVKRLVDGTRASGSYVVFWDLTDSSGARIPAGTYRVVLAAGDVSLCGDVEVR